jgi:hypothetical protein
MKGEPMTNDNDMPDDIDDLKDELAGLLTEPWTDDPLDTLKAIAETVGVEDYTYFDDRGQWVPYPQADA